MNYVNFEDIKPIYVKLDLISSTLMSANYTHQTQTLVEKNLIRLRDSRLLADIISLEANYYKYHRHVLQKYLRGMIGDEYKDTYYRAQMNLNPTWKIHER